MLWSAQKLQKGRVSDKTGKISRSQIVEKSKEISTTKIIIGLDCSKHWSIQQWTRNKHFYVDVKENGFRNFSQLEDSKKWSNWNRDEIFCTVEFPCSESQSGGDDVLFSPQSSEWLASETQSMEIPLCKKFHPYSNYSIFYYLPAG